MVGSVSDEAGDPKLSHAFSLRFAASQRRRAGQRQRLEIAEKRVYICDGSVDYPEDRGCDWSCVGSLGGSWDPAQVSRPPEK